MSDFVRFALENLPAMLEGTVLTLELTFGAIFLGFVIGLPISLMRVYGPAWLNKILFVYINFFRGTPLLVQLFVVYYGLPGVGLTLSRMVAAYITLGLNSSAYQAEYFRGAIQAVEGGQMVAARAIGMSRLTAIRCIILPQALRLVIPTWSNELISMIKYTAVVFLIAVPDLMAQAKKISSQQFAPIQTYLLVALIYLVLVGIASIALRMLSKRLEIPGLRLEMEEGH